jgi:hypothetical protein
MRQITIQHHVDGNGVEYGRVVKPSEMVAMQEFAHEHIELITRDALMQGAVSAAVAGFALTLMGALNVSIAPGQAINQEGLNFETLPQNQPTGVTLPAANPALPRIDVIYIALAADQNAEVGPLPHRRLLTSVEEAQGTDPYSIGNFNVPTQLHNRAVVGVLQGVAAAVPVAPAVGANQVALYQVRVEAAAVALAADKVTDVRPLIRSLHNAWAALDTINQNPVFNNFNEQVDDRVTALIADSTFLTHSYDDNGNLLTLDADLAAFDARYMQGFNLSESIDDRVAALIADSTFFTRAYDDNGNLLTLDADLIAFDARYVLAANLNELVEDRMSTFIADSVYFTRVYNDVGNLLTLDADLSTFDARYLNSSGNDFMTGTLGIGGVDPALFGGTLVCGGAYALDAFAGLKSQFLLIDSVTAYNAGPVAGLRFITKINSNGNFAGLGGIECGKENATDGHLHAYLSFKNNNGSTAPETLRITSGGQVSVPGSLAVVGNVSKGGGTFLIDHPLDPDNKNLIHSFIEGPNCDLLYRGRVKLSKGRAQVDVDVAAKMTRGTFAALTQNVDFFITNATGNAKVRVEDIAAVKTGRFSIVADDPNSNDTVMWLVIAERADPYIKAWDGTDEQGHLLVEAMKPEPTEQDLQGLASVTETASVNEDTLKPDEVEQISEEVVVVEDERKVRRVLPTKEREDIVTALVGKRGHLLHAEAHGKKHPTRKVTIKPVVVKVSKQTTDGAPGGGEK